MGILTQQPGESDDQFVQRKIRVFNSFVTSLTIQITNGTMFHANSEGLLDENNIPDDIRSILISTATGPTALNFIPLCSIVLFLDFTLPPPFDFTRLPTLATLNESNFEIKADNESWFAASDAKLTEFFEARKTWTDWLHRAGIYDAGVFLNGIPLGIWCANRVNQQVEAKFALPEFIVIALYVYLFLLTLNVFRLFFSYLRWVFPKVELDAERSSPFRHRTA